jgi:hypothetical protein
MKNADEKAEVSSSVFSFSVFSTHSRKVLVMWTKNIQVLMPSHLAPIHPTVYSPYFLSGNVSGGLYG